MEYKSAKSKKKGKNVVISDENTKGDDVKGAKNLRWTIPMERMAAEYFREERCLGNKGDGGWKTVAYHNIAKILSAQFNLPVTADHVRNLNRRWKKFYAVVSDILSQSGLGFTWNDDKKMIDVENEDVWRHYCESHEDAKTFRWKVIENWDDIVDLCAKDRATGEGGETAEDAIDVMDNEINSGDNNPIEVTVTSPEKDPSPSSKMKSQKRAQPSTCSDSNSRSKRSGSKSTNDGFVEAMKEVATSLRLYVKKIDMKEVMEEVNSIEELENDDKEKACEWLIENESKFELLKMLHPSRKKNYLMSRIYED